MKKRVISAIIGLIIIVPLLIIGGTLFYVGAIIIGSIGFYELIKLRDNFNKIPFFVKGISYISFLLILLSNLENDTINYLINFKIISVIIFLILLPLIFYHDTKKYNINDALFLVGVVFFLGLSFNFLITIRNYDLNYLIFLLLITIVTDTFAYLTGSLIGKHKMIPDISPKKTWEGFVGGTFMGVFVSFIFYASAFNYGGNIFILISIILLLTVSGQLGDLVFSSIKRFYEVKDFGNIMPGHGGVLDRLDSILFVIFAFSFVMGYL